MLRQIRWLRVIVAALIVEVGLTVAAVPFLLLVGEQAFQIAVPVACLVVPFVVALFATRPLPAAPIAEAAAAYGVPMFIAVNALRVVSAAAGGYFAGRRPAEAAV